MKLVDLNPEWVTLHSWAAASPFYTGMTFLCPHCKTRRLGVAFSNPVDPDSIEQTFGCPYVPPAISWHRFGETFDTLTLEPSISVENHWHGNIVGGEAR